MTTINPRVTFSCTEDWDGMKVGLVSRYCESCKRDVQDFTSLTRQEVLQFLLTNRSKNTCGRIFKSQLDYHHEEILVTIETYIERNKNSNLSFYLLAVGAMMLLSCSTNVDNGKTKAFDSSALIIDGQETGADIIELSCGSRKGAIDSPPDERPLLGEIAIDNSLFISEQDNHTTNRARIVAEVMPEFIGGLDKLIAYIKGNLEYPEWEKKAEIQGNVFVSFIVDEDGEILDPKILKSVLGSRNFDNEVLRLIKGMPKWKPGQEKGKNVAVQFVLPIKFKL